VVGAFDGDLGLAFRRRLPVDLVLSARAFVSTVTAWCDSTASVACSRSFCSSQSSSFADGDSVANALRTQAGQGGSGLREPPRRSQVRSSRAFLYRSSSLSESAADFAGTCPPSQVETFPPWQLGRAGGKSPPLSLAVASRSYPRVLAVFYCDLRFSFSNFFSCSLWSVGSEPGESLRLSGIAVRAVA
jgi:hypothetical protein